MESFWRWSGVQIWRNGRQAPHKPTSAIEPSGRRTCFHASGSARRRMATRRLGRGFAERASRAIWLAFLFTRPNVTAAYFPATETRPHLYWYDCQNCTTMPATIRRLVSVVRTRGIITSMITASFDQVFYQKFRLLYKSTRAKPSVGACMISRNYSTHGPRDLYL